jgi:hypothetical protein
MENQKRKIKSFSKFSIFFVLFFVSIIFAFQARAADYYVSTTGNNTTGTGTISNPWQTISKGQSALNPGDTLYVRGGRYYESVEITKEGTAGNPITIKAYPGETPILDGTEAVAGWTPCTSDDPLATVNDNYVNIYKTKIHKSKLPTDITQFMLFENGQHGRIARWPDQVFGYATDVSLFIPLEPEAYGQTTYLLDSDRLSEVDNYWAGAWVDVWSHAANNFVIRKTIASSSNHKLYFDTPLNLAISSGTKPDAYSIVNHLHILDTPGEFAYTMTSDADGYYTFYLWPTNVFDLSANIKIASKSYGFVAFYRKYLTIDGFSIVGYSVDGILFYTNYGVNSLNTGAKVLNCVVEDCGSYGIEIHAADYAVVDNCQVRRVGEDGIAIMGAQQASVKNCTIENTGHTNIYFAGCTKSSIINNKLLKRIGTHSNGIAAYDNCDKILIAYNYFTFSNLALQDIKNAVVYANVFDYEEAATTIIDTWSDDSGGSGHASESQVYLNNTILGSSNNSSLGLYAENKTPYPQDYVVNNIIDGCNAWDVNQISDMSYNFYTGYGWRQDNKYGWALKTGEIDGRSYSLNQIFKNPGEANGEDYTLISNSPVANKGKNVSALLNTLGVTTWFPDFDFTKDKAGNTWAAIPSMGAYECTTCAPVVVISYGDVSGDGTITAYDASLIIRKVANLLTLDTNQSQRADVNNDGQVNLTDAGLIAQRAVGLIGQF